MLIIYAYSVVQHDLTHVEGNYSPGQGAEAATPVSPSVLAPQQTPWCHAVWRYL